MHQEYWKSIGTWSPGRLGGLLRRTPGRRGAGPAGPRGPRLPQLRTVDTSSWLAPSARGHRRRQGDAPGRAGARLRPPRRPGGHHLGLARQPCARSASRAGSGYLDNGVSLPGRAKAPDGVDTLVHLRMTRGDWLAGPRVRPTSRSAASTRPCRCSTCPADPDRSRRCRDDTPGVSHHNVANGGPSTGRRGSVAEAAVQAQEGGPVAEPRPGPGRQQVGRPPVGGRAGESGLGAQRCTASPSARPAPSPRDSGSTDGEAEEPGVVRPGRDRVLRVRLAPARSRSPRRRPYRRARPPGGRYAGVVDGLLPVGDATPRASAPPGGEGRVRGPGARGSSRSSRASTGMSCRRRCRTSRPAGGRSAPARHLADAMHVLLAERRAGTTRRPARRRWPARARSATSRPWATQRGRRDGVEVADDLGVRDGLPGASTQTLAPQCSGRLRLARAGSRRARRRPRPTAPVAPAATAACNLGWRRRRVLEAGSRAGARPGGARRAWPPAAGRPRPRRRASNGSDGGRSRPTTVEPGSPHCPAHSRRDTPGGAADRPATAHPVVPCVA